MDSTTVDIANILNDIRPFVERLAVIECPWRKLFNSCLRSSVVKTFEFLTIASTARDNEVFFLIPALRSIAEDIIILSFVSKYPSQEREEAIGSIMISQVRDKMRVQKKFFFENRRFQPVLDAPEERDRGMQSTTTFWKKNGWPRLKKEMPPTRDIAAKCDSEVLGVVYDYIFRITSTAAHFSPQNLLRVGWGSSGSNEVTFDYRNLAPHFSNINKIYGSFLFCMYLDLFGDFLDPNEAERQAIKRLRSKIDSVWRWPEAVTFEEMNIPFPKADLRDVILHVYAQRKNFEGK